MNLVPDINEFDASETSSSSIVPVKNPLQRKKQQEKRRKPSEDDCWYCLQRTIVRRFSRPSFRRSFGKNKTCRKTKKNLKNNCY
ncbi:hypothetical protein BpHYR1_016066 [Brachionus plicatilis]|uniref:Uncharacterized protein n=1 Tax=Brachionus plicatilis TaxID=10195 RepID=A0A3M7SA42_BRAPC|nr:hypothetical protein BpHYR1_016066 [Brachionus plicatilis]